MIGVKKYKFKYFHELLSQPLGPNKRLKISCGCERFVFGGFNGYPLRMIGYNGVSNHDDIEKFGHMDIWTEWQWPASSRVVVAMRNSRF